MNDSDLRRGMDGDLSRARSRLALLPPELLPSILSALDDIRFLGASILTCRSLYSAFDGNRSRILTQVWRNQVGDAVLADATIAFRSSGLSKEASRSELLRFISDMEFFEFYEAVDTLTAAEAVSVARLNLCVRDLTQRFIDTCLANLPRNDFGASPAVIDRSAASPTERARIERAFYRFEIICEIASNRGRDPDLMPIVSVLRHFSPWEVEQIGCIHDFLYRLTAPGFNEIAHQDGFWEVSNLEPALWILSGARQAFLSCGLEKLLLFTTATSYDARHALIEEDELYRHTNVFKFLHGALGSLITLDRNTTIKMGMAHQWTDKRLTCHDEADTGPFHAWDWAHQQFDDLRLMYRRDKSPLRKWGYVLWDQARLNTIDILRLPWRYDCDEDSLVGLNPS